MLSGCERVHSSDYEAGSLGCQSMNGEILESMTSEMLGTYYSIPVGRNAEVALDWARLRSRPPLTHLHDQGRTIIDTV
jgi:hypothetical protein